MAKRKYKSGDTFINDYHTPIKVIAYNPGYRAYMTKSCFRPDEFFQLYSTKQLNKFKIISEEDVLKLIKLRNMVKLAQGVLDKFIESLLKSE